MKRCKSKTKEYTYIIYPFKGVAEHSKIPLFLKGKISQLKKNFKIKMPGYTSWVHKICPIEYE